MLVLPLTGALKCVFLCKGLKNIFLKTLDKLIAGCFPILSSEILEISIESIRRLCGKLLANEQRKLVHFSIQITIDFRVV